MPESEEQNLFVLVGGRDEKLLSDMCSTPSFPAPAGHQTPFSFLQIINF